MTVLYRTLVRGRLVQESSLCVGGSPAEAGGADVQCARDGSGRLMVPGTALAGALIDTTARIFPALFRRGDHGRKADRLWERITAKSAPWGPRPRKDPPEEGVLQSLWRFSPAHLAD